MADRYIHLVRHGQYVMERTSAAYGSLTNLGQKQARWVGHRLREFPINRIYASTMPRAIETAEILQQKLDSDFTVHQDEMIIEGIPEYPESRLKKLSLTKTAVRKTRTRMNKAAKKYFIPTKSSKDEHDIIVCHGNLIRYLFLKTHKLNTSKWTEFRIFQCSLTTIVVEKTGRVRMQSFGEIGHIPQKSRTFF